MVLKRMQSLSAARPGLFDPGRRDAWSKKAKGLPHDHYISGIHFQGAAVTWRPAWTMPE
jgi:hypothetical protein